MRISLKRPAALAALFTLSGAVLCALGLSPLLIAGAAAFAALILGIIFHGGALALTVAVVFASAAAFGFSAADSRATSLAEKYNGEELLLTGKICRTPVHYSSRTEYTLKTDLGFVELTCYGGQLGTAAEAGDKISAYVRLSAPSLPDNDGGFNERLYDYSRKIYLTAVAQGDIAVKREASLSPWRLAGKIQNAAVFGGSLYMTGDALGLYGAMVFGDRQYITTELQSCLREAGLSHIAAVSGMHLSIVISALMFLLLPLFGRGRFSGFAAIAAILAFTLITGGGNSTVRACIMSIIFLAAQMLYRDPDSLSSLSTAVTLMILFNPMIIYSSGFQLSALSTLSILLFVPLWKPKLKSAPKPLRVVGEILIVSLAAQLGATPVLMCAFNSLPMYFILSNLLVIPVMTVALPLGLLLPLIGKIPFLGRLWGGICSAVFEYIALAARKIASLPYAVLSVGGADFLLIAAYIFLAAALLLFCKRYKRSSLAAAAAALLLAAAGGARTYEAAKIVSVSFLNVGRGDCAVFRLPKGRTVMVDGGSSGYDAEDFLDWCGREIVDAAILTSKSREHMSGLLYLTENGNIGRLLLPAELCGDADCAPLLKAAEDCGTAVEYYGEGSELYVSGLTVRRTAYNGGASLIAQYGETRILFCADRYTPWPDNCSAVKIPNHGYGKYNYENEIGKAAPEIAIVSGYASANGGCTQTLEKRGIPYYVTGERGTVTLTLGGGEASVSSTR